MSADAPRRPLTAIVVVAVLLAISGPRVLFTEAKRHEPGGHEPDSHEQGTREGRRGMVRVGAWSVVAAITLSGPALASSAHATFGATERASTRSATDPANSVEVCAIVAKEAIAIGAGNPLRAGIPSATPLGNGQCRFSAVSDLGVDIELTVSTHRRRDVDRPGYPFGSREAFERIYGDSRRVRGVGKKAWFAYGATVGRQAALLAIRSNLAVQVVVSGGVTDAKQGRKQAVAIAAVTLKALEAP